jgi:hypothetical protein
MKSHGVDTGIILFVELQAAVLKDVLDLATRQFVALVDDVRSALTRPRSLAG